MASAPCVDVPGGTKSRPAESPIQSKTEIIVDSDAKTPASPWGAASSPWGSPAAVTAPPASFWGPKAASDQPKVANSFADIMSEELAVKLAADEEAQLKRSVRKDDEPEEEDDPDLRLALELSKNEASNGGQFFAIFDIKSFLIPSCCTSVIVYPLSPSYSPSHHAEAPEDSDLLMAQLLQLEFDKEYDAHLTRQEQHVNQNSKVTLSYRKFSHLHPVERDAERELFVDEEVEEERLKQPNLKFTGTIPGEKYCSRR